MDDEEEIKGENIGDRIQDTEHRTQNSELRRKQTEKQDARNET